MTSINPQHRSMVGRRRGPRNMSSIKLPDDVRQCVEQTAIDVFVDMTNAGQSFQSALAAIYLTGMSHGRQS